jgi:hypothetical protein
MRHLQDIDTTDAPLGEHALLRRLLSIAGQDHLEPSFAQEKHDTRVICLQI